MRRRITFIHRKEDIVDPSKIFISKEGLHVQGLQAAREDRVTANLYDLPQEVENFPLRRIMRGFC